ncbi:hypothetical protein J4734_11620 [Klebsiella pneumoniae]|uniref:Uncharacterized protein n=1 Tax=Klebsiella pneumoniae TaxID=573 RepID=A0A939SSF4_KLEPN|nr:hypothetical protein [Klebsiella pneumoniae]
MLLVGCYASCAVSSARKLSTKVKSGAIARWRLRLPGLGTAGRQAQQAGQAPRAARQRASRPRSGLMPGGGYATGPGCRQAGASSVGRASAAPPGKVFRPRTRPDARWRLRLTGPGYGRPVQAQ